MKNFKAGEIPLLQKFTSNFPVQIKVFFFTELDKCIVKTPELVKFLLTPTFSEFHHQFLWSELSVFHTNLAVCTVA